MSNYSKRGVILFIVLGTIIVVMGLAIIVLRIIATQSRLTRHQVNRIQAQYAAKAALIFVMDRLRNSDPSWGTGTYHMGPGMDIPENDLPESVTEVEIAVGALGTGSSGLGRRITATATYVYTPS